MSLWGPLVTGQRSSQRRQVEVEQDGDHVGPGQCDGPGGDTGFQPQQPKHEGQGCAQHRGTRDAPANAAQEAQGHPRLSEPDQPDQPDRGPGRQPEHQSRGQFVYKPSRDHLP